MAHGSTSQHLSLTQYGVRAISQKRRRLALYSLLDFFDVPIGFGAARIGMCDEQSCATSAVLETGYRYLNAA